jgi:hypothetical protein
LPKRQTATNVVRRSGPNPNGPGRVLGTAGPGVPAWDRGEGQGAQPGGPAKGGWGGQGLGTPGHSASRQLSRGSRWQRGTPSGRSTTGGESLRPKGKEKETPGDFGRLEQGRRRGQNREASLRAAPIGTKPTGPPSEGGGGRGGGGSPRTETQSGPGRAGAAPILFKENKQKVEVASESTPRGARRT